MSTKPSIPLNRGTPKIIHWLGFVVIIGLYFFVLRPIRVGFIYHLLECFGQQIINIKEVNIIDTGTYLTLSISNFSSNYERVYGLSFNSFFLFASLGLWALKNFKNSMVKLILIHLLGWIIATLFFFAGLYVHPNWWVGSDLITVYLIPMASLSWVAIVYAEQKRIPS